MTIFFEILGLQGVSLSQKDQNLLQKKFGRGNNINGLLNSIQEQVPEYKNKDYVTAYRKYYIGEKKPFAKWIKGRPAPEWWTA